MFTKSALDLVSTELEDAASIHGAGKFQTMARVTLPLVLPSIVGAAILIFLEAIALYGTPALIAIPARINLATTQIVSFFQYPLQVERAAAFSMPILLLTIVLLMLQRRLLARRGYVSVSGKGGERRPFDIGLWKWLLLGYSVLVALLAVILPLAILILASLSKAWGRGLSLDNLTLANFHSIFFEQLTVRAAILNTVLYSGATALVCVGMGICVAYATQRRITPFPTFVQFMALAPVAVPGLILAIGLYAAYAGPPFSLYGMGVLIVIAFTTRFLPISVAASSAGVRALNPGARGGGAHPRWRAPHGAHAGGGAAAEEDAGGSLHSGVRHLHEGAVDRGLSHRSRIARGIGADARPQRTGQLRDPRRDGRGAGGDRDHRRGDRHEARGARLHAAPLLNPHAHKREATHVQTRTQEPQ